MMDYYFVMILNYFTQNLSLVNFGDFPKQTQIFACTQINGKQEPKREGRKLEGFENIQYVR